MLGNDPLETEIRLNVSFLEKIVGEADFLRIEPTIDPFPQKKLRR